MLSINIFMYLDQCEKIGDFPSNYFKLVSTTVRNFHADLFKTVRSLM